MPKTNDIILTKLYPYVSTKLQPNQTKYKQCIGRFIEKRSEELYAIAPFDRIYFGAEDKEDFFKSTKINAKEVMKIMEQTEFYNDESGHIPLASKDDFSLAQLCIVRYYFLQRKSKEKDLELASIYLAFSGKFYASVHYNSFQKFTPAEYPHIMEYVINNELSNKYDIKREGSVFNAVKSICKTWYNTYEDRFETFDDDDVVYLIRQLRDRLKSFMKNIAKVYYKVYNDKDHYLTYDSDNLSDENFRLTDNDSLKIERAVENTITYINTNSVNYKICKIASNSNVKTDEIKSIIESIISDNDNIGEIKELCRIIISEYYQEPGSKKDILDIEFINKSIAPKPNSKNENIIREKEIIEGWLSENSPAYLRRRSREATKNSYFKSILIYFVLTIQNSNK